MSEVNGSNGHANGKEKEKKKRLVVNYFKIPPGRAGRHFFPFSDDEESKAAALSVARVAAAGKRVSVFYARRGEKLPDDLRCVGHAPAVTETSAAGVPIRWVCQNCGQIIRFGEDPTPPSVGET